ncbi:hypothetical protein K7432_016851 [Basidiobolus ranarum]|uniref:Pesticidal crystal protein domain-containing protein n=1 Tax=Basidiobolus ranarum TaxID=34480 RepID=A0ABR2VLC1_9FUNG
MPVTNENLIDFVCTGYSLIPLVGSSTGPAVAFFLKEAFGMNQSQSAPDMMISFISEYSLNDAKGQVKALKANANSLLDALNNWQKTQTSEAAQEVRSRNGYAISEARSLLEVLSSPIESQKAAVQIPMVTCAFMYLTMLADTIQNGDDWGYEPDLLKSYEAEMYRYADKVFEYVAWNYAKSGYEYNPKRWPKCGDIDFDRYNASADAMQRSLIYFTSHEITD